MGRYRIPIAKQAKLRRHSHHDLDIIARRRAERHARTEAREAEARAALRTALQRS